MSTRRPRTRPSGTELRVVRAAPPRDEPAARITTFALGDEELLAISLPAADDGLDPAALGLTEAEGVVARAVLAGQSHAQIAAARGTSARTVANQIAALYRKLGVGSRTELAARFAATDA